QGVGFLKKILYVLLSLMILSAASAPSFAGAREYVEGDVIVVLKSGTSLNTMSTNTSALSVCTSAANVTAASVGATTLHTYNELSKSSGGKVFAVLHSDTKTSDQLISELKNDPNVIAVSKNYISKLHNTDEAAKTLSVKPNDTLYSQQWGLKTINAEGAWEKTVGSDEVVVAVIDTGVLYDHEDLAANMWHSGGIYGKMFHDDGKVTDITGRSTSGASVTDWDRVGDIHGHGTHVAGIIGAVGNNGKGVCGINQKVKILTVGVFSVAGGSVGGYDSDVINGLNYVAGLKNSGVNIRAANMSFGRWTSETLSVYEEALRAASNAGKSGILFCVSAGNDSANIDSSAAGSGEKLYPACFRVDNMLTVGASTSENRPANYTNYSASGKYVDVFAPGTDILSTCRTTALSGYADSSQIYDSSGYISKSGTSMAAPMVTGAAALLAAAYPEMTAAGIKALIVNNGTNVCRSGYSRYGLIDLSAAMKSGNTPQDPRPVGDVTTYKDKTNACSAVNNVFEESDLYIDSNGYVTVSSQTASRATNIAESDLVCFPIVKKSCDNGVAVLSFELSGQRFNGVSSPSELKFYKILSPTSSTKFAYCSNSSDQIPTDSGYFAIIDKQTNRDATEIKSGKTYTINLYIRDGGEFDLDGLANDSVIDPAVLDVSAGNTPHGGGSSGGSGNGCSVGFGTLALALLGAYAFRKK
ncbi:MAG: S8 family serine peptidase, partial [Synergistes sp.]|nr:S8 family serine peptidase [Synergistes sp.]